MASSVFQINVKPNTPGEAGLPKIAIDSAQICFSGVEGDYNRFRVNKKNNESEKITNFYAFCRNGRWCRKKFIYYKQIFIQKIYKYFFVNLQF